MPSKGKRVAARQGSLRRRRGAQNQNQNRRPGAVAAGSAPTAPAAAAVSEPAPATAATAPPTAAPTSAGRPRGRRYDRPAAYNYVGSELTRIGIFSGVLVVVLVAVSFVL